MHASQLHTRPNPTASVSDMTRVDSQPCWLHRPSRQVKESANARRRRVRKKSKALFARVRSSTNVCATTASVRGGLARVHGDIMKWSNSNKFNVAHGTILVEKHMKTGSKHEREKSSHGEC